MDELVKCMISSFPIHGSLRSTRSHPIVRSCGIQQKNNKKVSLSSVWKGEGGRGGNVCSHANLFSFAFEAWNGHNYPRPKVDARSIDESRKEKALCIPAAKNGAIGLAIWSSRRNEISSYSPRKIRELLIVDGNIPTGALNFLPRRDMLGENLCGLSEGFEDRLRGVFVASFLDVWQGIFAVRIELYLSDRTLADVLFPRLARA